jgi:lipopolysaccharide transport system permease protein
LNKGCSLFFRIRIVSNLKGNSPCGRYSNTGHVIIKKTKAGVNPIVSPKILLLFKRFIEFITISYSRRSLIFEMARHDIATNHTGTMLGFFWTFVNPLIMIFILWFVFSYGLKVAPKGDVPFAVWLTAGIAIWNAFSEIVNGATGVIVNNTHLVKKVVFPLSILPVVKLVASLITHAIFIALLVVLILLNGISITLYWLQGLYYFFAMSVLALGLGWITSSINVFARDTTQIVNVIIQFGFWATPIFWDLEILPEEAQPILQLNPMYYIVQGYRDSFIYAVPFWQHGELTLYYWVFTSIVFVVGAVIFMRLRPHFADVL